MPKSTKRPHEIHTDDIVISHGQATGFDADVRGIHIREVETLEEAEAQVRDAIAKTYKKDEQPQIFVIDSQGMWVISEGE